MNSNNTEYNQDYYTELWEYSSFLDDFLELIKIPINFEFQKVVIALYIQNFKNGTVHKGLE